MAPVPAPTPAAPTSWKTTIAGLLAGSLNLYANGLGFKQVGLALAMAALGWLSTDQHK